MVALPPIKPFIRDAKERVTDLRQSKIFRDRLSLIVLALAAGVNVLNILILVFRSPVTKGYIPTHYSSLSGFEGLGPWYGPFNIAFIGLAVTIVNFVLATQAFNKSRLVGFFLIVAACVTALFCLIISNAFAMVSQ